MGIVCLLGLQHVSLIIDETCAITSFECFTQNPSDFTPQWGAADAEIKAPSDENTELKRSPYKAWSRSVYSHTCYAYCQGFLSFLLISTLPVHSPAFFPNPVPSFPVFFMEHMVPV